MKKTLLFAILLTILHVILPGKQLKLFLNTGGSFATHPESFRDDKKPCMIYGGGVGLELSKRFAVQASINYCSFYPREKYHKWMVVLDRVYDISHLKWYKGDNFVSFYNIMVDAKYFIGRGRFSIYAIGSIGYIFQHWVSGWTKIIGKEEVLHKSWRGGPAAGAGLGIEYRLNKKFGVFIESQYNVFWYKSYWEKGVFNLGFAPLKVGINYYL
jgi:hypothetical protein